ncbi:MAG: tetratricopeptide repeat protein [Proteobacteria bacterium]|nr:tetratricopeptide repeat protein [Pseudomonadota bacterium]
MSFIKLLIVLMGFFGSIEGLFAEDLQDAYQNFRAKKYEEAAKQFKDYNKVHPQDFDQLYNTGVALYQQGQFAEAEQYFDKARQSGDPKLKAKAAYNKGMASIGQNKLNEAEASLQEALSYDNDNKQIQENLAWVTHEKKKQAESPKQEQKPQDNQQAQQQQGQQQQGQQQQAQQKQNQDNPQSPADAERKANDGTSQAENLDKEAKSKQEQAKQGRDNQSAKPNQANDLEQAKNQESQGSKAMKANLGPHKESLTLGELKKQEAEKLLRSVDDRLGRYTLTPEQADMEGKSKNGKEW